MSDQTVPTPPDTEAWELREAYRVYSRWVEAGDRSSKSVWTAIQEVHAAVRPNKPTTPDTGELTGYAVTAAELRRIADALDTLPPVDEPPYVQLSILPEHTAEAVDAVALAVLRKPGKAERISGEWYHLARGGNFAARVHVTVQTRVSGPPDQRDAEIERLRAELAEAHAATATAEAHLGTNGAVAEAKPDTLMVPHGEPHRTVAPAEWVTTYFSFGHGQTDPDTGENLLDKYVTVIAPTYEACRKAMFASRYGERWSFDYPAGTATADEWIPQWTEHERIVVDPNSRPDSAATSPASES